MMRFCLSIALAFYALIALTACSRDASLDAVSETEEKHYQRAQRLLREGREDEALNAFLKVVEKRNDAAESNLEAGQLYAKHIGDPVAAIYHYRKYLELKPDSEQADRVNQMIDSATKEFARQLPGQPFRNDIDRLDLLEMLEQARAENAALKEQLAATQRRLSQYESTRVSAPTISGGQARIAAPSSQQSRTTAPAAASGPVRTHTVQSGETLSSISTKYYGNPRHFLDIFEANRDTLASPDSLRVGQQLKIPAE